MLLLKPKLLTLALAEFGRCGCVVSLTARALAFQESPCKPADTLTVHLCCLKSYLLLRSNSALNCLSFICVLSVSDFTISEPYGLVGIWMFEIKSSKAPQALEIVASRCPADV